MGSFLMSWNFTLLYENSCYCTYKMMNTYYKNWSNSEELKPHEKCLKPNTYEEKKMFLTLF